MGRLREGMAAYSFLIDSGEAGSDFFFLVTVKDSRKWHGTASGDAQVGYEEWIGTGTGSQGQWSWHHLCQTSKSIWTIALRNRDWILGSPVWSQELESVILVDLSNTGYSLILYFLPRYYLSASNQLGMHILNWSQMCVCPFLFSAMFHCYKKKENWMFF